MSILSPTRLSIFNVDSTTILVTWEASPTTGVTGYLAIMKEPLAEDASALKVI